MGKDATRRASRKRGGSATKDRVKERRRTAAATAGEGARSKEQGARGKGRGARGESLTPHASPLTPAADRDALVAKWLPLAQRVAERMRIAIDPDERQSAAHVALLWAIERYDPARGMTFTSFLFSTVRRALLDAARVLDHLPRVARRRCRETEKIAERLMHELGRPPSDEEIRAAGGQPEYVALHARLKATSFDARMGGEQGVDGRPQTVGDAHGPSCRDEIPLVRDDQWKEALRVLSIREFVVLYHVYHDKAPMKDIGALMGLSESRISQIHSAAVARLRGRREELYEAFGK